MESLTAAEALILGVGLELPQEEIDKFGDSTEGIAAGMEERLKGANEGLMTLGKRSTQGTRAITGLASAVSLVNPRLGQMIRSVGSLGRGLQVLRLGFGPAAIAIGALTAAAGVYAQQQEELARIQEQDRIIADSLASSNQRLQASYERLAVATGDMTAAEYKLLQARRQNFAESLPGIQETGKAIFEEKERLEELQATIARLSEKQDTGTATAGDLDGSLSRVVTTTTTLTAQLEKANAEYSESANRLAQLELDQIKQVNQLEEIIKNTKVAIETEEAKADAVQRSREATKAAREEEKKRQKQLAAIADMHSRVVEIEAAAAQSIESEEERILRVYWERIEALDKIERQTQGTADTTAARQASEMAMEEELYQLRQRNLEELEEKRQRQHQEEIARIQKEADERAAAISDAGSMLGSFSSLANQVAQQRAEHDQAAAERALALAKSLAAAEATANYFAGIVTATAATGANPITTPLRVGALTATYATQLAAIASTTLHRGGMADEVSATLTRREAVLNPLARQTIGDENIRRAQAGQSPRGDRVVVVERYRHQTFNRFIRDNLEMGSPVSQAINAGQVSGHRTARKGI